MSYIYADILKSKPHDSFQLERYIRFISKYISRDINNDIRYDKHHICPKATDMFPEYESFEENPWNLVYLTDREHFIAHMMLWKSYRNASMTYAANMLSNFRGVRYTSKLYEKHRADFRNFISENNSAPKNLTKGQRENISNRFVNTIVVYDKRDPDKKTFMINKDDSRYNPEFMLYYRTGTTHSEETKRTMSERNGVRGKKACYNPNTNKIAYAAENRLPEGFVWGYPEGIHTGNHIRNTIWCHNPITDDRLRVEENSIPKGYIRGKGLDSNPGFEKANEMTNVVDLQNRRVTKVFDIDPRIHAPQSGVNTERTLIYVLNGKIFTSLAGFNRYARGIGFDFSGMKKGKVIDDRIRPPHGNCNEKTRQFRAENQGKTYKEMGLEIIPLQNFNLSEHEEKEIYWNG